MKKRISLIILAIVMALSCFALSACSKSEKYGPEFEFSNPVKEKFKCNLDEGMTLDGKNTESVYADNVYYETVSTDGSSSSSIFYGPGTILPATVKMTSHFGEKGIYVYVETGEQHIVRWNATTKKEYNRNWNKTGISLYMCKTGVTSRNNLAWEMTLAADGEATMRKFVGSGWTEMGANGGGFAVDVINGKLDENGNGTCDGYNVELFMPWESLDLNGKPDMFMLGLALIRHPNATGRTERLFEYVTPSSSNPINWLPFNENGRFVPADPTEFTIDGNLNDWADYSGNENRIELFSVMTDGDGNYIKSDGSSSTVALAAENDLDERFVSNKMVYGSDGLYISTQALMRIYLNDSNTWWRNSSVEMRVRDKNLVQRTLQFGANGYATSGLLSAWSCTDSTYKLGDETLKLITHEAFVPKAILKLWMIDADDEIFANYAFRNGRYQPGDGDDPSTYTLDLNETKQVQFCGSNSKPYIFHGLGSSPYSGGGYLRVTKDGIVGAAHSDEKYTLDGNATEWADYKGVRAVSMGRMGADGDATDANKGYDVMARKGKDGVYFYATVRHALWNKKDVQSWMSSNLALGFALTTVDHINETAEFLDGSEFFFTANGPSVVTTTAWMSDNDNAQPDADGLYTTVVEGFVPYSVMLPLDTTSETRTNRPGQWRNVFNPETGEIKDGYALRLGIHWRTRNEIIGTQGRNDRADMQALDFFSIPVFTDNAGKQYDINRKDSGWRMYYLTDSGIHTSKKEAKHAVIDGKDNDWAAYPTDATEYKLTGVDSATSVNYKAMLKEDGLYVLATARMKNYFTANAFEYNLNGDKTAVLNYTSQQWYRNTNIEIFFKKKDGTTGKVAYVTPFTFNNDLSDMTIKAAADTAWTVSKNGNYYDSTVEVFINAEYLKHLLGVTSLPASLALRLTYTSANLKGVDDQSFAPENTDLYGSGSYIWNNGQYVSAGYYGLMDEFTSGETDISSAEVSFIEEYDEAKGKILFADKPLEIVAGITLGGEKLMFGRDYTIEYNNIVDVGTATYTIKGINAYCGEINGSFEICGYDIADTVSVTVDDGAAVQSTGGAKPIVTVKNGDETLIEGEDYVLVFANNLYLNEAAAGGRYKASVTVDFVGKYNDTADSTHEYTYAAYGGADKLLMAESTAFDAAVGQTIEVKTDDAATDGRGLAYKAQLTQKGLYIVGRIRHNTLVTMSDAVNDSPWNSSHIEIRIGKNDSVRGFVNYRSLLGDARDVYYEKTTFASGENARPNSEGFFDLVVLRLEQKTGETYAYETVFEAFMSNATLDAYGVGIEDYARVSLSFKTSGEKINALNGGESDRWLYNGLSPEHLGVFVDQTGIMSRMVNNGDGSYDNLAVLEKGYITKSATELTFDGNDNDWTDYNGFDIKVYARGVDEGKSFEFKSKLGDEGMYFFAESKHDVLITNECAGDNQASQIALEFMVGNKSQGTAYNAGMTFLSALGGTHVDGSVYIFKSVTNGSTTPKYTTTVEGLIPWQSIIGGYINIDGKTSDDIMQAIDAETGLKDGWGLYFNAGFRTQGETYRLSKTAQIGTVESRSWIYQGFRSASRPALTATDFNDAPYKMFGVTENGIDDLTDSYAIDGVADSLGSSVSSKHFDLTAANDTVFTTRPITHYGKLTSEGLYYAMQVQTNNYDLSNDTWWKNLCFKMRALKPAAASSSDNIELLMITGDGGCYGTDYGVSVYEWNIVENPSYNGTVANGFKYTITLELFLKRAAIEKKVGAFTTDLKICPEFVATANNNASYVLIDGKSGGQRWFVPTLWEGTSFNTDAWFYANANGLTSTATV